MPSLHIAGALVGSVFLVGQAVRVRVKEGVLSAADDAPPNLRDLTAVELKMSNFRSTLSQVLGSDVEALSEFVGDKITLFSGELAKAADVCDGTSRAATKAKLLSAFASIKSRLVMVVSTAAKGIKGDAKKNAATAREELDKLKEMLTTQATNIYDEHLNDTLAEIEESFAGIAKSAEDGHGAALPEGLVGDINRFSLKVAELSGKLAMLSEDTFKAAKPTLDALTTSTGQLVGDLSRRFSMAWEEVVAMNDDARSSVVTYGREALQGACSRQIQLRGKMAFKLVEEVFSKVVAAANNGVHEIMADTADNLAAAVAAAADEK